MAISHLEDDLGVKLFYREKNRLILTKEAEILLPRIEAFRQAHDLLVNEASNLSHNEEKAVNISFTGSIYLFTIIYMAPFLRDYKETGINLSHVNIDQARNMLLTYQTDLAISCYPITHPLISVIPISEEPIGLVIPKVHPLARKKSVSAESLARVPIHGLNERHYFRNLCDRICAENHIQLQYVSNCNYREYYDKMREENSRAGFLSTFENFRLNFEPSGKYAYLDVDIPTMTRLIGVYYLSSEKKNFEYADLISTIQANFISQGENMKKLSSFLSNLS